MGTWDIGIFDNDAALDFVAEVTAANDLSPITAALQEIKSLAGDTIAADIASQCLVAGEIIAALRGNKGSLPAELATWLTTSAAKTSLTRELQTSTQTAVALVRDRSELRDLWEESDEFTDWVATVENLYQRLL